jgi:ornithine cyclodeaminase/alanine dehydrogenase-like protein (mu-crystallin family)
VDRKKRKDDQMASWLEVGNVIYKSVGLGLMDLTVGTYLIQYAKEKEVGSHIDGF